MWGLKFIGSKIQAEKLQIYPETTISIHTCTHLEVKCTFPVLLIYMPIYLNGKKITIYTSLMTITECPEFSMTFWYRCACGCLSEQILLAPKGNISA
jgi:hypothetical protein